MEIFKDIDASWVWLAAGLALAGLELAVPGVYLIWLAMAAIITGLLTFLIGWGLTLQALTFVSLSLIVAYTVKRWLRNQPIESPDPLLNNRGERIVGQNAIVVKAIVGGEGRAKLGDSEWICQGPDCKIGTHVQITKAAGAILTVEPIAADGAAPSSETT